MKISADGVFTRLKEMQSQKIIHLSEQPLDGKIRGVYLSRSEGDQEEKGESTEHDPMNRCQEVESKECGWMKGVPYSERVTVNPVSG